MSGSPSEPSSSRQAETPAADNAVDLDATGGAGGDDDLQSDISSQEAVEVLTKSTIRRSLSDIQRSSDKENYAFTRLDLSGQNLKTLEGELRDYPELKYVNVSNNELLELTPLSVLPQLLSLDASRNHIHEVDGYFFQHDGAETSQTHLQLLQLDHNEIEYLLSSAKKQRGKKVTLQTSFPQLYALTVSNNKLGSLLRPDDKLADFAPHETLAILDVSFNQLPSLAGLSLFPNVKILNVANNSLEHLDGIQHLKSLEKINVSENKLTSLFATLKLLAQLPNLQALVITQGNAAFVEELEKAAEAAAAANPDSVQTGVDMVSEILMVLPRLTLLDGKKVTATMRKTANLLKQERLAETERRAAEEAEAKRLQAEEEAAEAKRKKEEEEEEEKEKEEEEKSDEEKEEKEEKDENEAQEDAEAEAAAAAAAEAENAEEAAPAENEEGGAEAEASEEAGGDGGDAAPAEDGGNGEEDGGEEDGGEEEEDGEGEEEEGEEEEEEEDEEEA